MRFYIALPVSYVLPLTFSAQSRPGDRDLLTSYEFLNLMRKILSVQSNVGVTACMELVNSTVQVVPEINVPKNCLLWRKQLDLLNEVLCYGSTLALQVGHQDYFEIKHFNNTIYPSFQSDVPQEVGQVAKAVIKEAITSDFLASPDLVPRTGKGFVGDADLECADDEKTRSQQFMQSYALLHLKSVALAFREATYCR